MTLVTALMPIHVSSGILALLTFMIPMIASKGGKVHRWAGWTYVLSMVSVAISAIVIGLYRLFIQEDVSQTLKDQSVFLIMIAIFASNAVWSGIRVLRFKSRLIGHRNPVDLGFSALRVLIGAAVIIYGFTQNNLLLSLFPLLPIITGIDDLRFWIRSPTERMHWWFHHMESMFIACIATVTAFVVTAVPRLMDSTEIPIFIWFAPALVMVPTMKFLVLKYKRQFAKPA